MKSIVALGWSIWTCNSKSLQVYADQGSLLGRQEEAADLASRLTAAEHREAGLKAALSAEQASHQGDARLASARDAKASADLQAATEKVKLPSWAGAGLHCPATCPHCLPLPICLPPLPSTAHLLASTALHCPPLPSTAQQLLLMRQQEGLHAHHLCSIISEQRLDWSLTYVMQ